MGLNPGQVLQVIEHKQHRSVAEGIPHAIGQRLSRAVWHPGGLRDVGRNLDQSVVASKGTNTTPSGKAGSRCRAAAMARRVLPAPPGPVRVTRRTSGALIRP